MIFLSEPFYCSHSQQLSLVLGPNVSAKAARLSEGLAAVLAHVRTLPAVRPPVSGQAAGVDEHLVALAADEPPTFGVVKRPLVPQQRVPPTEGLRAQVATERQLPGVRPPVGPQVARLAERFAAVGADVRQLPGVYPAVSVSVRSMPERHCARLALVRRPVSTVQADTVPDQVAVAHESHAAGVTPVLTDAGVSPSVAQHVGRLAERLAAVGARVRPLPGVPPHVYEQDLGKMESHAAFAALAGPVVQGVNPPMYPQITGAPEHSPTDAAGRGLSWHSSLSETHKSYKINRHIPQYTKSTCKSKVFLLHDIRSNYSKINLDSHTIYNFQ